MNGSPLTTVVVGAAGYIGGHICRELSEQGITVHAFSRRRRETEPLGVPNRFYYTGDLCNRKTIDSIVNLNPDAIIYCVSLDQDKSEVDTERAVAINVTPLWTLVDNLNRKIKKPVRFVYLSTTHVYGTLDGRITEESIPQPRTVYGLTHLMCEQVLGRYSFLGTIEPISVRLSNGYGPPMSENPGCWTLVLNDFCRSVIEKEKIQLSSDGTPQRDFLYVEDIASSIVRLLQIPYQELMQVYNIGSGNTKTVLELAIEVQQVYFKRSGCRCPILLGNGEVALEASNMARCKVERQFVFDVSASRALGMSTNVPLVDGVNKLFDFLEGRCR
ncbi:MAG: NAD-dependent epimerase/dehydratase family protein [Dehalococcoidia bacterium]|nr:NAD-dependent epimerase/dehydratase family protein [Dehalococcoidia bacterium]